MDHSNNQFYKNHHQHSTSLSWGWLTVIAVGLIPLIFLVIGNRRNRPMRRRRMRGGQQQLEQQEDEGGKRKTKNGKYVYSGWRVIVCLDYDVDVRGAQVTEGKDDGSVAPTAAAAAVVVDTSTAVALQRLAAETDLYVIVQVDSDEKEHNVMQVVKDQWKLFEHGLAQSKLLFCETNVGRVAIARQIEPSIYIDRDEKTVRELKRFIRRVGFITNASSERSITADLETSGPALATVAGDLLSLLGKLY